MVKQDAGRLRVLAISLKDETATLLNYIGRYYCPLKNFYADKKLGMIPFALLLIQIANVTLIINSDRCTLHNVLEIKA